MKYRKKPIVIDAVRFERGMEDKMVIEFGPAPILWNKPEAAARAEKMGWDAIENTDGSFSYMKPVIETLEGQMACSPGDYIITGVKGERYPCKPDIFEATYELAE